MRIIAANVSSFVSLNSNEILFGEVVKKTLHPNVNR